MSENTYLEQYINLNPILPRNLHDWLVEALKELKNQKYERQIKKIHELIDYVENEGEKLALYQKVNIELLVIKDNLDNYWLNNRRISRKHKAIIRRGLLYFLQE